VTMCEAYMGIEHHFYLWNYFFCVQLELGSDMDVVVWGSVDISIQSGSESIRTSTFLCPTLWSGGGRNGFF
jgi:hypothetical protein